MQPHNPDFCVALESSRYITVCHGVIHIQGIGHEQVCIILKDLRL